MVLAILLARKEEDNDERKEEQVLIDFLLTAKAATLIFISGRGSAFSYAIQGKSGSIYKNKLFGPRKRACILRKSNRNHTEFTFINP